jgi:uncharacterized protein (DUF2062 family)
MAGWYAKMQQRTRTLWLAAKTERASPQQIGWAFGVGVFAGCTPAMLLHGWIALGLATLLKLNRLFCWIGSRVSNFMILPWIILAEIQLSHRIRTGEFLELTKDEAVKAGPTLLLDWCLGTIPVGGGLAVVLGFVAYGLAVARARKRAARETNARNEASADDPSADGANEVATELSNENPQIGTDGIDRK